jgi:hypothetical protein
MKRNTFFMFLLALSFGLSSSFYAQTILDETFNYPAGDTLCAHNWTPHSGGTSHTITVTSGSLTYAGFVNSGLGNSVSLTTSGEDANRKFYTDSTQGMSGAFYASFLVNVTSAQTAGDYFFHFTSLNPANGLFRGRVYVKKNPNGTGGIAFGVGKASTATAIKYTDTTATTPTYFVNTTYLLVVKYSFSSAGTADDTVSLWVNPVLNGTEPTPTLIATDATAASDAPSICAIALRQGSATAAPALILTGIHLAKSWDLGSAASASLSLTSPVGGESWLASSSKNITWTSTGVTNVKLEVSADGGSNWSTIIASTAAAANSYAWTVPSTAGTNYKVRISDVDGKATAVTSGAFTVTTAVVPTLAITAPAASANWTVATSQNITWTSSNVTTVKLEYSSDSAATWNTIVANTPASAGTYAWTVPSVPSTKCFVKVSDSTGAATASTSGLFSIAAASAYTTIASIRANNASGVPTDSGQIFTVTGWVTSANQIGKNAAIQDNTAGMTIYDSLFAYGTTIGDSVVVKATLTHYRGLAEMTGVTFTKSGVNSVQAPTVITCAQMTGQAWNGVEAYESKLVKIKNVTIAGTGSFTSQSAGYVLTDASGTATLYINKAVTSIVGQTIPTTAVNITGIVSQYKSAAPYSSGYQLLPRQLSDIEAATAVAPEDSKTSTVKGFALSQNYPNPFNPTTTISFSLDKAGLVSLKVYNILGTEVASLVNEFKSAGNYSVPFNATSLTSGVYLYKLQVGSQSLTKKLTLMK